MGLGVAAVLFTYDGWVDVTHVAGRREPAKHLPLALGLGGVVMTLPRLYYAAAEQYRDATAGRGVSQFFRALAWVPARSAVPAGSVIFAAALSIAALCFFSTFRRIVTYFLVPLHLVNILLVASVFRLRPRLGHLPGAYRTPGYPLVPAAYILVLALFLVSAIAYNPLDTLIGVAMTATGVPVYMWIRAQGHA